MKPTCRAEILEVVRLLEAERPAGTFRIEEVVRLMQARQSSYAANTIRAHVNTLMCRNAPACAAPRYPDLERVAPGLYCLAKPEPA